MVAAILVFVFILLLLRFFTAYLMAGMIHVMVVAAIAVLVKRIRQHRQG